MTHAFIVYEEIPETLKMFLVPMTSIPAEIVDLLKMAHGVYVNAVDHKENDGNAFMIAATLSAEHKGKDYCDHFVEYEAWLDQFKVEEIPAGTVISMFVRTGFYL